MLIAVAGSSGLGRVAGISATHPAALVQAVDRFAAGKAQPAHEVILLSPWYAASMAREQAHVVVAADPQARVCVLALHHHALTLTLLAELVLDAEGEPKGWTDPGGAVQLLKEGAARSRSLVWYPRVLGLSDPVPTPRQRASWLFRSPGFFGEVGVSAGLTAGRAGLAIRPDELWYSSRSLPPLLAAQLGGTACHAVSATLDVGAPFATKTAVELTGLIRPVRSPLLGPRCRSCSARLLADGCAFCGGAPLPPTNSTRRSAPRTVGAEEQLTGVAA